MQSNSSDKNKNVYVVRKGMHEIATESESEISPSKLRSPPPKPPRRRHSEQLSATPSGTFPSCKKKPADPNKILLKDNAPKIKSNNKLGCGSLPANWTPGFQSIDISGHINSTMNTSEKSNHECDEKFYQLSPSFDHHVASSDEKTDILKKGTYIACIQDSQSQAAPVLNADFISNNNVKIYQQKHCFNMNGDIDIVKNKLPVGDLKPNINELCSCDTFQKELHRRHHSDPLLYVVNQSCSNLSLKSKSPPLKSTYSNNVFCDSQNSILRENECLQEELKNLKEVNDKVWEQLCSVQVALDNLGIDDQDPFSISEFLSQLYRAQKAKDCAMEERLKLAIEERNAALAELEEMVLAITKGFDENDSDSPDSGITEKDKEIKDLLQEIERTHNPAELLQQQRVLLSYLYRLKEAKQDRLSHDLKVSLVERDNALAKVKKLEEELKYTKLCNDICHFDTKHWETSLLDVLCQVIEQRDVRRNDPLHELKQYKRSPKSQKSSNELSTKEPYQKLDQKLLACSSDSNVMFKCFQSPAESKKCHQFSPDAPQDELKILKEEVFVLTKALEDEIKRREHAEENCLRYERLVHVLRKKINGQNVGVPL